MVMDLAHCHLGSETVPSGSLSVAVNAVPACGCNADRVTVPGSSTLVTSTVDHLHAGLAGAVHGLDGDLVYVVGWLRLWIEMPSLLRPVGVS